MELLGANFVKGWPPPLPVPAIGTKGCTYLHAPVFMGPANALESTGIVLVSGNQEVVKKTEPALTRMTGKVVNFGPLAVIPPLPRK